MLGMCAGVCGLLCRAAFAAHGALSTGLWRNCGIAAHASRQTLPQHTRHAPPSPTLTALSTQKGTAVAPHLVTWDSPTAVKGRVAQVRGAVPHLPRLTAPCRCQRPPCAVWPLLLVVSMACCSVNGGDACGAGCVHVWRAPAEVRLPHHLGRSPIACPASHSACSRLNLHPPLHLTDYWRCRRC